MGILVEFKGMTPEELAEKIARAARTEVLVGIPRSTAMRPGDEISNAELAYINEKGDVFVNSEKLEEPYIKDKANEAGLAANIIELGEDEYFVLGDNRNNSQDSRFESVGNIHRSDLIGRAWIRIWPLNEISLLKHQ